MAQQTKIHKHGPWFSQQRIKAGLTQAALAERAGVSRAYVTQIETGSRWPSQETLYAILAVLNVPEREAIETLGLVENKDVERAIRFVEFVEKVRLKIGPKDLADFQRLFADDPEGARWLTRWVLTDQMPPAPEGWVLLDDEDRRLIQRHVNRLLALYGERTEAADADQA